MIIVVGVTTGATGTVTGVPTPKRTAALAPKDAAAREEFTAPTARARYRTLAGPQGIAGLPARYGTTTV